MSRIYLFVILAKPGNTLQCAELVLCVYIYVLVPTKIITTKW